MLKYIKHKTLGFVLFEASTSHDWIAGKLGMQNNEIISAGFVGSISPNIACFGESETLKKNIQTGDSDKLNRRLES